MVERFAPFAKKEMKYFSPGNTMHLGILNAPPGPPFWSGTVSAAKSGTCHCLTIHQQQGGKRSVSHNFTKREERTPISLVR
jgi:hypothetical protein